MNTPEMQKLRGQLVLLEKRALAALDRVSSLEELQAWKRVYIEGESPAPEGALFSTFITNEEILTWEPAGDLPIAAELADEAYCRWQDENREQAERYCGVWDGHVQAAPGGYHVWIEPESPQVGAAEALPEEGEPTPTGLMSQAQELVKRWHALGAQSDKVSLSGLRELDVERTEVEAELADIFITLLPAIMQLAERA